MALSSSDPASWPKVLLVEDDESHRLAISVSLEREGMAVTAASSGCEALAAHDALGPDLVLLDVVLGDLSGIEVCRALRARGWDTPVIMVSSRGEEADVVIGMEAGADDYLAKPLRTRELVARIRVLLRRRQEPSLPGHRRPPAPPQGASGSVLAAGDLVLDVDRHEVRVGSRRVELALREFQVLRELLANAGRVVTRDELLQRVWGLDYDGDPRIVSTLVGRLRGRLEASPGAPRRIVTIRGVGYRLDPPAPSPA